MRKGTFTEQRVEFGRSLGHGLAEPLVEETPEEDVVKLLEASPALLLLTLKQFGVEVVGVSIKEALLLDEVDEHHAVEHEEAYQSRFASTAMPSMKVLNALSSLRKRS